MPARSKPNVASQLLNPQLVLAFCFVSKTLPQLLSLVMYSHGLQLNKSLFEGLQSCWPLLVYFKQDTSPTASGSSNYQRTSNSESLKYSNTKLKKMVEIIKNHQPFVDKILHSTCLLQFILGIGQRQTSIFRI